MQIHVDAAADRDGAAAARRLLEGLARVSPTPPDFLSVHLSPSHDVEATRRAFAGVGARALHGGTSCLGVMAGGRMVGDEAGGGLGLFALWDADGDYGTGHAPLDGDPRAAGRAAATRALAAAGRPGEAPDLVWLTVSPGAEEAVIAGIEDVVGAGAPIVGGSAADDDVSGAWRVFGAAGVEAEGVCVSVLFPSRPVATAFHSGYAPTETAGLATRVEGRRVLEIDGRPAAEVYAGWTAGAVAPQPGPILAASSLHPLGRHVADVAGVPFHLLAHPAAIGSDGGLDLFADVAPGEALTLMTGSADSLVARAGRVASFAAASQPDPVAGALLIYCGGCMLTVRDRMDEVAAGVDAALGGAPVLGLFTFGEQGAVLGEGNRHGNLMISCVTFCE